MVKIADTKKQSVRPNNSLIPRGNFDEHSQMPNNFRHPYAPHLMYAETSSMMGPQSHNIDQYQLYQQSSMVQNINSMEQYSNYNMNANSHQMNMKVPKYPMNMMSSSDNFELNAARSNFQNTRPPEGDSAYVCQLVR